ncbi:MAG: low-specificity L-threonine aldolase [Planctomycetes bacterium]|nr:low-specificity L-threonine aldolase [Planctomycetota bacterium]
MIDLRSDTITKPDEPMRRAMAQAEVGDDVLGDDPTVADLEKRLANFLEKEAAVFMPSGTMANQVAVRTHTEPGDEIIVEAGAHIYYYEAGGPAALSGVMCRLIEGRRGIFSVRQLRDALRPGDLHFPRTRLVCIENTHNRGGGSVWPIETLAEVCSIARQAGLAAHLDGARLWNASVASDVPEREYCRHFDSVSVCFSKGLGAPVGSCLAGTEEFIRRARRFRKLFGGGMRQAGILAAAAIYAMRHNRKRLADDHSNARLLADELAKLPGIELDPSEVETNIVFFHVTTMPAAELVKKLRASGVAVLALGHDTVRAVTSLEVDWQDIMRAVDVFRKICK